MKKKLFSILFFLIFLPASSFAASFSVTPSSGDAGTTLRLNFSFTPDTKVQSIKIYVPPCNPSGCPSAPYYDIDENSIGSSFSTQITTESYEGKNLSYKFVMDYLFSSIYSSSLLQRNFRYTISRQKR